MCCTYIRHENVSDTITLSLNKVFILFSSLPMDGDVVLYMVNHFDNKTITLPCYDPRPRKLTIDSDHALCVTKSSYILVIDLHHKAKPLDNGKQRSEKMKC